MAGRQQGNFYPEGAPALERARAVHGPRHAAAGGLEQLLGALRGLLARRVGIEEGDDLVAVAAQEGELRPGECGAERRYRLRKPVLVRHQTVDVAFDEQRPVLRLDRGPGEVGGVEQVALGVERRLRRVEVLRLLVPEPTPAEGHHPALKVADREQETPSEAVVDAGAVLSLDGQPSGNQRVFGDLLRAHEGEERVPALRGIAETEALRDGGVDAALLEICARPLPGRLPERVVVEAPGKVHDPDELLAAGITAPAAFFRQRDSRRPGERADRFGERETVLAHEKAEHVAAHTAAEAVEDPLSRIDHERRGLLGVEGTEALPVDAGLAEVHEPTDEIDDVHGGPDVVEQRLGVLH